MSCEINRSLDECLSLSCEECEELSESPILPCSNADADLARQWFDAVQDLNPQFLGKKDYVLAKKLYEKLGMRVPNSILEKQ